MPTTLGDQEKQLGFLTILENPQQGLVGGYLILNHVGRPTEFHCTSPVRANRAQEILYGNTLKSFLCGEQIAQTLIKKAKSPVLTVVTDVPFVLAAQDFVETPLTFFFSESFIGSLGLPPGKEELETDLDAPQHESVLLAQNSEADGSLLENASNLRTSSDTFSRTTSLDAEDSSSTEAQEASELASTSDNGSSVPSLEESCPSEGRFWCQMPLIPGLDVSNWTEYVKNSYHLAIPNEQSPLALDSTLVLDGLEIFLKSIDLAEPFERICLAIEEAQKSG